MMAADRLPLHGIFIPVAWVDAEKDVSAEERRADTPFSIVVVFQKVS